MQHPPIAAESVGVRPEHLTIVAPADNRLRGTVVLTEYTGAVTLIHVELLDGHLCLVVDNGTEMRSIGTEVSLMAEAANLHHFSAEGLRLD